jgi:hypothetical protein
LHHFLMASSLPRSGPCRAVPYIVPADGFERESENWMRLVFSPSVGQLMMEQLAAGAQTRDGERELENLLRSASAKFV